MKYVVMVYQDEKRAKAASEEELARSVEAFNQFHAQYLESGTIQDGQRLRHSDTATTVRIRDGKRLITDGPFAETKEHLAGFYLIEVDNLDDALDFAADVPTAQSGSIEIRPVYEAPSERGLP